ncbi:DUF4097 family beta strand repeat-containing protein [Marinoscillum furvescens]|uniref:Putative adhesin n=1 Tax=Marinoscillum furvescens DSM 4134 TaxID=1122208 RepID=A0A3D9L1M8_MARFU|nr:DUF4097 family beta strand repeat-containing protein [Marinoscillum furvescens]RED97958.1 putative adhesin [Marinoscillum furvescens DSM 4134]
MRLALTLLFALSLMGATAQQTLAEIHFESENISSVIVQGVFCDVTVEPGRTTKIDGLIAGDGSPGDYEFVKSMDGGQLLIKVESRRTKNKWSWGSSRDSKIAVTLPEGVTLQIKNTSGDVQVERYTANTLDVQVTSGDVSLETINANLSLNATSGDLSVEGLTGDVTSKTTSGDQEFTSIKGNISVVATSGDLELAAVVGNITGQATSGDIEIEDAEGAIVLQTTSGDISGEEVLITGDSRFKATSGDVEFELLNDFSDLSFDLKTSSGSLRAGAVKESKRLILEGGKFDVLGVTTSGSQYFYE